MPNLTPSEKKKFADYIRDWSKVREEESCEATLSDLLDNLEGDIYDQRLY